MGIWRKDEITRLLSSEASSEAPREGEGEAEGGLFHRFKRAIARTRQQVIERIQDLTFGAPEMDPALWDALEEALIATDMGPRTAQEILERARQALDRNAARDMDAVKGIIQSELLALLRRTAGEGGPLTEERLRRSSVRPYVILVVGVNGTGKTTTIGKLAYRLKRQGFSVLLCGADTFRAAAADQLAVWAERAGVPVIEQHPGADPVAVLFDALRSAKARGTDVVIADTAGRLHTKINLMHELQKMCRVAAREVEGAPHEVLLVLDAVTGQNGLEQARRFGEAVGVTGVIVTKLDGTAKGGILIAIAKELGVPIHYVGVGETLDDLIEFSPEAYVRSLFDA
jgi:fused signal recognition particle receptor